MKKFLYIFIFFYPISLFAKISFDYDINASLYGLFDKKTDTYKYKGTDDEYDIDMNLVVKDENGLEANVGMHSNNENNLMLTNEGGLYFLGDINIGYRNDTYGYISMGYNNGYLSNKSMNKDQGTEFLSVKQYFYTLYDDKNIMFFDGSYFQYNDAFNISYQKTFFDDSLKVGVSYIPNFANNISLSHESLLENIPNIGAVDSYINFNQETNFGLGYSLTYGNRYYLDEGGQYGYENLIVGNLSIMGFNLMGGVDGAHFLPTNVTSSVNYSNIEAKLSYSILKLDIVFDYVYSNIVNFDPYDTSIYEIDLNYRLAKNLYVGISLYKNILREAKQANNVDYKGIALGGTIKI